MFGTQPTGRSCSLVHRTEHVDQHASLGLWLASCLSSWVCASQEVSLGGRTPRARCTKVLRATHPGSLHGAWGDGGWCWVMAPDHRASRRGPLPAAELSGSYSKASPPRSVGGAKRQLCHGRGDSGSPGPLLLLPTGAPSALRGAQPGREAVCRHQAVSHHQAGDHQGSATTQGHQSDKSLLDPRCP